MHVAQLISDAIYYLQGSRTYEESLGPGEVQQGPRVPGYDHQAAINRAFIEKYCAPR